MPLSTAAAVRPGLAGDRVADRNALGRRGGESLGDGVRAADRVASSGDAPASVATAASASRSAMPRLECTSSMPCASLVILATPPAMVTRGTGWSRMYFSMPPTKSPMSMSCTSCRPWSFCAATSEALPVAPETWEKPMARATSTPRWMEWIQDEQEYGNDDARRAEDRDAAQNAEARVERALGHLLAVGHGDLDLEVGVLAGDLARSPAAIILRGTGLMAGSPGGIGRPGRVTRPTPSPRA